MFKIKLQAKQGYDTTGYKEKIEKAISIFEKVINSDEFKNKVLNFKFRGKKQFVYNLALSNQDIYNKIMAGAGSKGGEKF